MDMGSGAGNGRRLGCRGRGSSCSVHFHSSADTKMNPKACFVVLAAVVVVAVLLGTFARRIGIVRSRV